MFYQILYESRVALLLRFSWVVLAEGFGESVAGLKLFLDRGRVLRTIIC